MQSVRSKRAGVLPVTESARGRRKNNSLNKSCKNNEFPSKSIGNKEFSSKYEFSYVKKPRAIKNAVATRTK